MHRNRQFDRMERGQTILKEYATDRGAERFKTNATVLSVVLDLAKLCGFGDAVIEHEAKRSVMWYVEHENRRIVPASFRMWAKRCLDNVTELSEGSAIT